MMEHGPFTAKVLFTVGPVPVTEAVAVTWGLIGLFAVVGGLSSRALTVRRPGRWQAFLEVVVAGIGDHIADATKQKDPPYAPLIAALFLFLVVANLTMQVPGVPAPTATLETAAALAVVVFLAGHWYGVKALGIRRYLARYLKPNPMMLPLNVLSELTRTLSLTVRLFGNIMSHELIVAILLALAGLLVPIPIMALGVLIGLVQAYIFAVLATIFIAAATNASGAH